MLVEQIRGPAVARRHGLPWPHGEACRPPLPPHLVDLPCRPPPESRPVRRIHPLATTPEPRPPPPVPIPGRPEGHLVDLSGQLGVALGTGPIITRRTRQRQQDTGPARREPTGDQALAPCPARRHRHDLF